MKPFRLEFKAVGLRTPEVTEKQMRANLEGGWPMLEERDAHDTPLAVVGGGPSAVEHLDELREWPGDIWAVNQSAPWLKKHAPKANVWMFTIDPDEALAEPQFTEGVDKAILSSACHPSVFEALKGREIRMFHCRRLDDMPELICLGGGRCAVARTPLQAAWQGYLSVTYFGCEGSLGDTTHAYRHEHRPNQFIVRAGGVDYVTTPDLCMNTEDLSEDLRTYPKALKEKSGGLLRAMVQHPDDWVVVALSGQMKDRLDPTASPYDPKTYQPRMVSA